MHFSAQQHLETSMSDSRLPFIVHSLPCSALAGQFITQASHEPHLDSTIGKLSVITGASVSTAHIVNALPYSSVTSKLLFPIKPNPLS